jgi:hypothetical protein
VSLSVIQLVAPEVTPASFRILRATALPCLRKLQIRFKPCHDYGADARFFPFGNFGENEAHYSHPEDFVLPESLTSQLNLVIVHFDGFKYVQDFLDLINVFGDARSRGVLKVYDEGALLLGE